MLTRSPLSSPYLIVLCSKGQTDVPDGFVVRVSECVCCVARYWMRREREREREQEHISAATKRPRHQCCCRLFACCKNTMWATFQLLQFLSGRPYKQHSHLCVSFLVAISLGCARERERERDAKVASALNTAHKHGRPKQHEHGTKLISPLLSLLLLLFRPLPKSPDFCN